MIFRDDNEHRCNSATRVGEFFLLGSEPHASKWKDGPFYLLSQPFSVNVSALYIYLVSHGTNRRTKAAGCTYNV